MSGSDIMSLKRTANAALSSDSIASDALRVSPAKTFVVPKAKSLDGEHSLASMMSARHSGLHQLHKKFAEEMEQRRRVSFGGIQDNLSVAEPPIKRRRFQRRNSKTAAMLFSSMSAIVASDFNDEPEKEPKNRSTTEDTWDGGLEIAEELVRQLKLRRQSLGNSP